MPAVIHHLLQLREQVRPLLQLPLKKLRPMLQPQKSSLRSLLHLRILFRVLELHLQPLEQLRCLLHDFLEREVARQALLERIQHYAGK